MSANGQVLRAPPEPWEHAHACYTCQQTFACTWAYCKEQARRNCPSCRAVARPTLTTRPEDTHP
jgi:hypothetical protein